MEMSELRVGRGYLSTTEMPTTRAIQDGGNRGPSRRHDGGYPWCRRRTSYPQLTIGLIYCWVRQKTIWHGETQGWADKAAPVDCLEMDETDELGV
jgi:hypothetical protein